MTALARPPATRPTGTPTIITLARGTSLRRVHRAGRNADSFNPTPQPSKLRGGRFDSLDGSYAYTYLGDTDAGAIAETVCRDLPFGGAARVVPAKLVQERLITTVDVTRDLPILALHGAHLTQVHAPLDLTKCDASQYEITREWAQRLREWLPAIAGLAYRARHDEDEIAWVLFQDRPPTSHPRAAGALHAREDSTPLDSGVGLYLVKQILHAHNATLA